MLLGIMSQVSLEHILIQKQWRVYHLVETKEMACAQNKCTKITTDLYGTKWLYLCLDRDAPGDPHWPWTHIPVGGVHLLNNGQSGPTNTAIGAYSATPPTKHHMFRNTEIVAGKISSPFTLCKPSRMGELMKSYFSYTQKLLSLYYQVRDCLFQLFAGFYQPEAETNSLAIGLPSEKLAYEEMN